MISLKASADCAEKLLLFWSPGSLVRLKSPKISQSWLLQTVAKWRSSLRNSGWSSFVHGPQTLETAKVRLSTVDSKKEVREWLSSRWCRGQALISPPEAPSEVLYWKELKPGGKKEAAFEAKMSVSFVSCKQMTCRRWSLRLKRTSRHLSVSFRPLTFQLQIKSFLRLAGSIFHTWQHLNLKCGKDMAYQSISKHGVSCDRWQATR